MIRRAGVSAIGFLILVGFASLLGPSFGQEPGSRLLTLSSGLKWRMIGPFRGGRALAGPGGRGQPRPFFFGAVGGGVLKTPRGGGGVHPIIEGRTLNAIGGPAVAPTQAH